MKIDVLDGPDAGRVFEVGDGEDCIIGRGAQATIQLNDPESSRQHARIFSDGPHVAVEDLNSRNGTWLNGEKVSQATFGDRDELLVGKTRLRVTRHPQTLSQTRSSPGHNAQTSRILVSLQHKDADLLAGESIAQSAADMLHENKLLRNVGELSNLLASGQEMQEVLVSVLDRIQSILSADTACVLTRDSADDDGAWQIQASSGDNAAANPADVSLTIVKTAAAQGVAILCDNPLADSRFDASESIIRRGISSAVCAPMKIEDRFSGVLFIDRCNGRTALTSLDLRFAATAANMMAVFVEKAKLQQEVIRQERLAAVGQVIAGLAHYAKNIITALRLGVSLLARLVREKRYDAVERCVQTISIEERRLTDLLLDMLTYAKDRKPERSEVRLQQVVQGVAEPYIEAWRDDGINFVLEHDSATPSVSADANGLHRVFLNLLLNAVDALREVSDRPREIRVSIAPVNDGNEVLVTVQDTGPGIPPDKLSAIFTVFFSTKGSKGTGLGLAVSQKIVQEHGGRIEAASEYGAWTEFRVTLPTAAPEL